MSVAGRSYALLAAVIVALGGCTSGGSSGPPKVDPETAAADALKAYDKDGDGRLSENELSDCPALLAALEQYDADKDGAISADELTQRLTQLYGRPLSFVNVSCGVTNGGRPVPGAEVTLTPVPFLGDAILPATGITDENGIAKVSVAAEQLPENLRNVPMMQVGLYSVEIKQSSLPGGASKPLGAEIDPSRRDGTTPKFDVRAK